MICLRFRMTLSALRKDLQDMFQALFSNRCCINCIFSFLIANNKRKNVYGRGFQSKTISYQNKLLSSAIERKLSIRVALKTVFYKIKAENCKIKQRGVHFSFKMHLSYTKNFDIVTFQGLCHYCKKFHLSD